MFGTNKAEKAYMLFTTNFVNFISNDIKNKHGIFYNHVEMLVNTSPFMRKSTNSNIFSKVVEVVGQQCALALDKHKLSPQQNTEFINKLRSDFKAILCDWYVKIASKYFNSSTSTEAIKTDVDHVVEIITEKVCDETLVRRFMPKQPRYHKMKISVPIYHQKEMCDSFAQASAERLCESLNPNANADVADIIVSAVGIIVIAYVREYQASQPIKELQENVDNIMEILAGDLADTLGIPDFEGDNMIFNAFASMPENFIKDDLLKYYRDICYPQICKLFNDLIGYSLNKDYPQLYSDGVFMQTTKRKITSLSDRLLSRLIEMRMDDYRYYYYEANLM